MKKNIFEKEIPILYTDQSKMLEKRFLSNVLKTINSHKYIYSQDIIHLKIFDKHFNMLDYMAVLLFATNRLPNLKGNNDDPWSPNIQTVIKALASVRICSALWNNITDCDETYNYWEPVTLSLKFITYFLFNHFLKFRCIIYYLDLGFRHGNTLQFMDWDLMLIYWCIPCLVGLVESFWMSTE